MRCAYNIRTCVHIYIYIYMGRVFPNIGGNPPKWMVKIMENSYEQMDDLGGFPPIFGSTPTYIQ